MNGDPWTDERDQELRQWCANGRSNKEIAELAGRTKDAIMHRKNLLGLRGGSATCQRCGAPLMKKKTGRPRSYCSQACESWAWYEAETGHKPPVEVKGVCAYCKKPFARTVGPRGHQGPSAQSAYCSRDCDKAAWYLRRKAAPDGAEFMRVRSKRTDVRKKRLREARGPLIPSQPTLYLPWTLQEDRLLKQMYLGAVTYKVIAIALGRSTAAVGNRLLKVRGSWARNV